MNNKIYVGSRFWVEDATNVAEGLKKLEKFIGNTLTLGVNFIGIAVRVELDKSNAFDFVQNLNHPKVKAIKVAPWGKFVPALAALLEQACLAGCDRILYTSPEIEMTQNAFNALLNNVDENTLVAGLRLPGHKYSVIESDCDGEHSPWNTAALWRVKGGLDRIGYPSVGEALFMPNADDNASGVEEVGAIAVYQMLYNDCDAKLVYDPSILWEHDDSLKFKKKMASKQARPAAQIIHTKLILGKVEYVDQS